MVKIRKEVTSELFQVDVNKRMRPNDSVKKTNANAELYFKNVIAFVIYANKSADFLESNNYFLENSGDLINFTG